MEKSFSQELEHYVAIANPDAFSRPAAAEIKRILDQETFSEEDFFELLSAAALTYIEPLAQKARQLSWRHFGRVVHLYAPLYLSNYCDNECVYCGFNRNNPILRKTLSIDEVKQEAREIATQGLRSILLLTGESRQQACLGFIKECIALLREDFSSISLEIYPLTLSEYKEVVEAGSDGLTLYQETYDQALYRSLHGRGPKRDFSFRLEAVERAAQARMRQINLGVLLGLGDWRRDVFLLGVHTYWLQRHYTQVEIAVSLPRLRPQVSSFAAPHPVDERNLAQALIALRLFLPACGITISTRETSSLRRSLIGLGVTRMSAGSRTEVGGYSLAEKTEAQFAISDQSSVAEVKEMISQAGYQPVVKDW